MALADVCIHTATPQRRVEDRELPPEEWIAGEPGDAGPEPEAGTPFDCVLFLPQATDEPSPFRPRQITRPTLLYLPLDHDGDEVTVSANDELLIAAPELTTWTGASTARWMIDVIPQPFGPPGTVIGVQATLARVLEGSES